MSALWTLKFLIRKIQLGFWIELLWACTPQALEISQSICYLLLRISMPRQPGKPVPPTVGCSCVVWMRVSSSQIPPTRRTCRLGQWGSFKSTDKRNCAQDPRSSFFVGTSTLTKRQSRERVHLAYCSRAQSIIEEKPRQALKQPLTSHPQPRAERNGCRVLDSFLHC